MKRLLALILILALLPVVALADESDVIGCWVHYELLKTGAPSVTFLFLAEGGVCYYLIQHFNVDEPGLGRTFVGTWEMQKDGSVLAKTGNNAETKLKFYEGYNVAVTDFLDVFVNITPFTLGGN